MSFDMGKFKILAIDLDGTMLNHGELSPVVEKVLAKVAALGVEIAISTGRSLPTIPTSVRSLPYIRYAITSNGGNVYDYKDDTTINEEPMSIELALKVLEALRSVRASSYIIAMYPDTMVLPVRTYLRYLRSREYWKRMYSKKKSSRKMVKEALKSTVFALSLSAFIKRRGSQVEKINLRFASLRKFNRVKKLLGQLPVEAVTSMGLDLEITAKGVTKAFGLQKLCDHLSISPEHAIAAGDSYNDLKMLKFAGFAIAMGNAEDDIKEIADFVAPDVKEDGLASALTELFELK